MILSFKHKGLEQFFATGSTADIQANHEAKLRLQLSTLDSAETINAMDFPGWNLHKLKGNLANHWSIKVNANWRLTFKFENGHAEIVDYQDYH
ncbi:Killer protein [Pasteurellaceae bacterium 15-036681]|nr:Killer protein [Pasteurellaceae bacterium 15-036681]